MKSVKRTVPPTKVTPPKFQQRKSDTSLTKLIRANVRALQRECIGSDKSHNAMVGALEHYKKTGELRSDYQFSPAMIEMLKDVQKVDANQWTRDRLTKTLGMSVTVIRKVFEDTSHKGSRSLKFEDVIPLAIGFGVSPGFLLQPNRIQLENNSLLSISGMNREPFTISAHDWFNWVHGIAALPGWSPQGFESRMIGLITQEDEKVTKPHELTKPEINRAFTDSNFGVIGAGLAAMEMFHPMLAPKPPKKHPLHEAKRLSVQSMRMLFIFKTKLIYMTHARRGLRLIEEFHKPDEVKQAIDWTVNKLRWDLSEIAANLDVKKKT